MVVGGNGSAGPGGHRDHIYKLVCTSDGQCKWELLEQKLQVGRSDHVAMLVPDSAVACKKQYRQLWRNLNLKVIIVIIFIITVSIIFFLF